MRFVKPLKGFRFWRTLGMLFFSAAVATSQVSTDKAYALEVPVRPQSLTLAAAPLAAPVSAPVFNTENNKNTKSVSKKKVKAPASEENKVVVASAKTAVKEDVQKPVNPKVEIIKAPESINTNNNVIAPVKSVEAIHNEVVDNDFKVVNEELPVPEKVEKAQNIHNQELKVKTVENSINSKANLNHDIKPEQVKQPKSSPNQLSVNNFPKNTEKKPIVKTNNVKLTEPVMPETIQQAKASSAKKNLKKKAIDESVVPQEWDWFSTPLVWVEDGNGKMVLVADKTAPKISLNEKKVEPATANNESKAVLMANELPLITTVAPAEPDFVQVMPVVAEDVIYSSEIAPSEISSSEVREELEFIPAVTPEEVEFEEAPVASDDTAESVEAEREVEISSTETNTSHVAVERNEYKPFAKALERMERIRRLRKAEAEERGETLAKANRSVQAIRMSNYINELINKSEDTNSRSSEKPVIQIRSNVSADDDCADVKQAEENAENAFVEAKTANNENSIDESNNAEKTTFKPYIGVFGSNSVRRARYNNWKYGWTR